ncbi:hypothetical protein [Stetteria hydrogenophila]
MARVYVPERLLSSRVKRVAGPAARLRHPRASLMLAIVAPKPGSWRVEPHLLWSPAGDPPEGVVEVAGHVALVRYEGLREVLEEGLRRGLYHSLHLAPWGLPLLMVGEAGKPSPDVMAALDSYGAAAIYKWLKESVARRVEVVEV